MPEIPEMLSEPLIAEITSSHAPINPKLFIGHQGHAKCRSAGSMLYVLKHP